VTEASLKYWNLSWYRNLVSFLYKNPNTETFVNIPADPTRMRTEFNLEPWCVSGTRYFMLRWIIFRDVGPPPPPEVTKHKLGLLFILGSVSWLEMEGACPGGSVGSTVYRKCCFRLILRYYRGADKSLARPTSLSIAFIVTTGILRLPWLRFLRDFSSVLWQILGCTSQKLHTIRTLPN
jgi:hypothetical protein